MTSTSFITPQPEPASVAKPPSSTQERVKGGERLGGIDVMRGLAAFGVICIHSGLVAEGHVTSAAQGVQSFFSFVVPFFLMAGFYFALRGELTATLTWRQWLSRRATRLLLPYVAWSSLYFVSRCAKFLLAHQQEQLIGLVRDPIGLIFFNGGSSIALYFIPVFLVGLTLIHYLARALARFTLVSLLICLFIAFGVFGAILVTGNAYDLGSAQAFRTALPGANQFFVTRTILVLLAHCSLCLPFIFASALTERVLSAQDGMVQGTAQRHIRLQPLVLWLLIFLALSLPGVVSAPLISHVRGIVAFLIAWYASSLLGPSRVTNIIGGCAFGVYLAHQAVLELMALGAKKLHLPSPLGAGGLLLAASAIYLIALGSVSLASYGGPTLRRVFGIA